MEEEEGHDQTIIAPIKKIKKEKKKNAYIIFLSGPLVGKVHLLEEGAIVVGRGDEAHITVDDVGISRQHASIHYHAGVSTLKDLQSTNGTYLNGRAVQESQLKDGDKIQISSSTIIKYAYQDKIENIFHKELYKMAIVDALTGAYNKRYFKGRLKEEFSYSLRNSIPLSLLMFDIDFFKKINDTYGHPAGDYVLGQIANLTRSIVRNEDLFARYGGEEFIIILKATDSKGAQLLAERLRQLIEKNIFEFQEKKIKVTVSIGISSLRDKNLTDWESMLKQADDFLYQSKNSGRNRVTASPA